MSKLVAGPGLFKAHQYSLAHVTCILNPSSHKCDESWLTRVGLTLKQQMVQFQKHSFSRGILHSSFLDCQGHRGCTDSLGGEFAMFWK